MSARLGSGMKLALQGEGNGERCRVRGVAIRWSPLPVERLLIGQRADDARALIPAALALCHEAHCAAAQRALDAVAAAPPDAAPGTARNITLDVGVRLEAARETLRRWLLDFPAAFGEGWPEGTLAHWPQLDTLPALTRFCAGHVFGDVSAAQWLALDQSGDQGLGDWAARGISLPARWLRALLQEADRPATASPAHVLDHVRQHADALLAGAPVAGPHPPHADLWDAPVALPDLASGLFIARLRRLARICAQGESAAAPASGGERQGSIGIGWTQTARGLLVHLARVEQGRVAAYRILPPTHWNFGPATLLTPALADRPWADAQRRFARLALLLDPCVPFDVQTEATGDA